MLFALFCSVDYKANPGVLTLYLFDFSIMASPPSLLLYIFKMVEITSDPALPEASGKLGQDLVRLYGWHDLHGALSYLQNPSLLAIMAHCIAVGLLDLYRFSSLSIPFFQ